MSITLARTWHALGFWEKTRLLWSLLLTGVGRPAPERLRTEIEAIKRVGPACPLLICLFDSCSAASSLLHTSPSVAPCSLTAAS